MSRLRIASCRSAAVFATLCCSVAISFGQASSARVEGQATDASGRPIAHPVVQMVSDPTSHTSARPWRYTLVGDSLGKYSQEGIAPGAYLVMLFTDGKGTSVRRTVLLKGGDRSVVDLDMRPVVQVAGSSGAEPGPRTGLRPGMLTR